MTPQEALANIKRGKCIPYKKATISQIAELCEKEIPKKPKPIEQQNIRYSMNYICPACGKRFSGTGIADYCYHCGQALDWSDTYDGQT